MNKTILIILIGVIVGFGGYFLINNNKTSINTPTTTDIEEKKIQAIPTTDTTNLQAGGSSYAEENGVYTVLYPSDFVLDESDKLHIRIYKTGPTQQGQTEMYDGVLLVFEVINLNGKNLSEWVDTTIQTLTENGTSEITEPKQASSINNLSGFTYSVRGLGESKNYVFQKDENSNTAVLITTLVSDPGNIGFQNQVDQILLTLEILK